MVLTQRTLTSKTGLWFGWRDYEVLVQYYIRLRRMRLKQFLNRIFVPFRRILMVGSRWNPVEHYIFQILFIYWMSICRIAAYLHYVYAKSIYLRLRRFSKMPLFINVVGGAHRILTNVAAYFNLFWFFFSSEAGPIRPNKLYVYKTGYCLGESGTTEISILLSLATRFLTQSQLWGLASSYH